jgi:hypothetical protein
MAAGNNTLYELLELRKNNVTVTCSFVIRTVRGLRPNSRKYLVEL